MTDWTTEEIRDALRIAGLEATDRLGYSQLRTQWMSRAYRLAETNPAEALYIMDLAGWNWALDAARSDLLAASMA